jgi:hypothetical protein
VSSPNEPGYPRTEDRPGGANGSAGAGHDGGSLGDAAARSGPLSTGSPTGHVADKADVPPWERGVARANTSQQQTAPEPTRSESPRGGGSAGHSPGVDARLNRFMSGGSTTAPAPAHESEPLTPTRTERPDVNRPEAYASELPDLSGPVPRPPQRKSTADRPAPEARSTAATGRIHVGSHPRGPVRASMQIRRIDPWSTLKVSLILSVVLFFVWMIAVAFLYLVLGGMGVWSKLNSNVGDLLTSASGSTGGELVSSSTIFGGAALIGLVNIVVLTAMATVGAFIYNLTTDLVGGVEVTLADRD